MTNSALVDHNFRLSEIEEMMPWELQVYLSLTQQKIKDREDMAKQHG